MRKLRGPEDLGTYFRPQQFSEPQWSYPSPNSCSTSRSLLPSLIALSLSTQYSQHRQKEKLRIFIKHMQEWQWREGRTGLDSCGGSGRVFHGVDQVLFPTPQRGSTESIRVKIIMGSVLLNGWSTQGIFIKLFPRVS